MCSHTIGMLSTGRFAVSSSRSGPPPAFLPMLRWVFWTLHASCRATIVTQPLCTAGRCAYLRSTMPLGMLCRPLRLVFNSSMLAGSACSAVGWDLGADFTPPFSPSATETPLPRLCAAQRRSSRPGADILSGECWHPARLPLADSFLSRIASPPHFFRTSFASSPSLRTLWLCLSPL